MDLFINWIDIELSVRIIFSVILVTIIGFEREIIQKSAGHRTHIFMCMGSCLFIATSIYILPCNSELFFNYSRIAAGILTATVFL